MNGFNLVSTIPAGVDAWLYADGVAYLRFVVIGFDQSAPAPDLPDRPAFEPRTMVADPVLFRYGKRIADACEGLVRSGERNGESLGRAAFLASVLLPLRAASKKGGPRLAPWQLRRVMEFVEGDLISTPSLPTLANICRLSPAHFGRAFRGSTGIPPRRWMTNMRLRHAQSLLLADDTPLAELAGLVGFADQSHFTRVFAKATGRTPGAWRREIRARLGAFDEPPRHDLGRKGKPHDFAAIVKKDGRGA
jgi:AraC-like DNA-binding protein